MNSLRADFACACRRHWLLAIVLLASVIGLGLVFAEVLCAYAESHYDYLTSAQALPSLRGPA